MRLFENRRNAAEELVANLEFIRADKPIVMGLLNGGIILAEVIAEHLQTSLDVMLIEKLHAPKIPDHVVGVVDEHGRISMIESTARWHHLTSQQMVEPARKAFELLQKKRARIREILPEVSVRDRVVVLVDEGVVTGARMLGAISSLRDQGASKIVVTAPAGLSKATWQLNDAADHVVIPHQPNKFKGVDHFYKNFPVISDETVYAVIERSIKDRPELVQQGIRTRQIHLTNQRGIGLNCEIDLPPDCEESGHACPAVIFAHGFESNAVSPRNVPISQRLAKRGIIGIRLDFTGHGRSEGDMDEADDQQMLEDLRSVYGHVAELEHVNADHIGLVGSGTGGLIALQFAASEPGLSAMVLRGPLCGDERELAAQIKAPTLIIHAEGDTALEEGVNILDKHFVARHECMRIPNSNRLFNDPISMELMINSSVDWLHDHLLKNVSDKVPEIQTARGESRSETSPTQS